MKRKNKDWAMLWFRVDQNTRFCKNHFLLTVKPIWYSIYMYCTDEHKWSICHEFQKTDVYTERLCRPGYGGQPESADTFHEIFRVPLQVYCTITATLWSVCIIICFCFFCFFVFDCLLCQVWKYMQRRWHPALHIYKLY